MVTNLTNNRLTTHKNNKKPLSRGSRVEVANKVSREDVQVLADKNKASEIPTIKSVTEPVNIRVDNHIRNDILGFVTLGKFDSYKEFCEYAVEVYKETMSQDELKRHKYLKETYEIKDFERVEKKKQNKKK